MATMKRTSTGSRNRALTEFAQALNLRIRITRDNGQSLYRLLDSKGEPLCLDYTDEDAAQSIAVYAGSHPSFPDARVQYGYAIGEQACRELSVEEFLKRDRRTLNELLSESLIGDENTPALCEHGCEVEADGTCEHGCRSILRAAGLI